MGTTVFGIIQIENGLTLVNADRYGGDLAFEGIMFKFALI